MKIMKDTWMHLSLHGNGLLTIFKGALPVERKKMTRLGYFPIFDLTHNGNYVVLLGPSEYTQSHDQHSQSYNSLI